MTLFDLEQQILRCWSVCDDIQDLRKFRDARKLTEDELWVNLNRASSQVFGYTLDYHGKHEVYLTLAEITNFTGLPSTKIQSQLLEGGGSFVYRGFQITSLARP